MAKKEKKVREPEYFTSYTNIPTLNYAVYYMKPLEKLLYAILAFIVGAVVGYIFFGGLGKDEFDNPTKLTYILNISISSTIGLFAAIMFIPMRTKSIIAGRKRQLKEQFRELLDSLSTSLGSGKNVTDAFHGAYQDMAVLFSEDKIRRIPCSSENMRESNRTDSSCMLNNSQKLPQLPAGNH